MKPRNDIEYILQVGRLIMADLLNISGAVEKEAEKGEEVA